MCENEVSVKSKVFRGHLKLMLKPLSKCLQDINGEKRLFITLGVQVEDCGHLKWLKLTFIYWI